MGREREVFDFLFPKNRDGDNFLVDGRFEKAMIRYIKEELPEHMLRWLFINKLLYNSK